jgi:hypothetical protein
MKTQYMAKIRRDMRELRAEMKANNVQGTPMNNEN